MVVIPLAPFAGLFFVCAMFRFGSAEQVTVQFMDAVEQFWNVETHFRLSLSLCWSGFAGFCGKPRMTGTRFAIVLARHAAGGKGSSGAVPVAIAQVPTIND
ncbi:MAG: hypothetical protein IPJ38_22515 [Dechloromonas sp.]|uniref:Uncharacterized protein n=1 Tax=Candidatus Dechloromonas phosphorivorans TaxID=2899244 RepID=A0A935K8H0_9RHOO|nr:hypothetical protein [Candidatus Dechloromonas phosphorivorans]